MRYTLLLLVLLLLAACAQTTTETTQGTTPISQAIVPGGDANVPAQTVTSAELASHASANDCWIAYKGKVYDITAFLPKHPNMKPAQYCGSSTAFEQAFEGQHGMKKVPVLEEEGTYKGALV